MVDIVWEKKNVGGEMRRNSLTTIFVADVVWRKKNERKCEENEEEGKKFRQNKIGKSKILTINVYPKIMFIITLFTWIKKHLSHGVNKSEMIWMSDEHFLILKNIFFQSIFLIIIIHWNM